MSNQTKKKNNASGLLEKALNLSLKFINHPLVSGLMILLIWSLFKDPTINLSYEIINPSPLIQQESVSGAWDISYKEQPVSRPYSIIYRFKNEGNADIDNTSFEQLEGYQDSTNRNAGVIEIDFDSSGSGKNMLLDAGIEKGVHSSNANPRRENLLDVTDSRFIRIKPFLIKPGEYFDLRVIVDNYNKNFIEKPYARMKGKGKGLHRTFSYYSDNQQCLLHISLFCEMPKLLILTVGAFIALILLQVSFKFSIPENIYNGNQLLNYCFCYIIILAILGIVSIFSI